MRLVFFETFLNLIIHIF